MNRSIVGFAGLALLFVTNLAAAQQVATLDDWVSSVNRKVARALVLPNGNASGQSEVIFRRGPDGSPTDIHVVSGDRRIAFAAHRTVQRLRDLPPLPTGFAPDHRIKMNLLIGDPSHRSKYEEARVKMNGQAVANNTRLSRRPASVSVASINR